MVDAKVWGSDSSGDWNTGTNWNPATVPAPDDDVTLPAFASPSAYTVSLESRSSVNSLTIGGPTATLDLSSGALAVTTGFDNSGTLSLNNSGILAGTITNESGGTIVLGGTFLSVNAITTTEGFINDGRLISGGGQSNYVNGPVTNAGSGTISVTSGILSFSNGINDSGSISVNSSMLILAGGTSTIAGTVSGDGFFGITNGNASFVAGASIATQDFYITAGTATVETVLTYAGVYDQTGGTLDLASSDALILAAGANGTLGGGTIAGSGVLLNRGMLTIRYGTEVDKAILIDGVILRNGPGGTAMQSSSVTLAGGATIENHVDGVYDLDDASIFTAATGTSVVNGGSFVVNNAGASSTIAAAFTNKTGAMLSVLPGLLVLTDGLINDGSITLGSGSGVGALALDGGTSTIAGTISGSSGILGITAGNATFVAGGGVATEQLVLSGGSATIAAVLSYAGDYSQIGGTLDIAGGEALILTGDGSLDGGTVTGSGVLLNQASLTVTGGTVSGNAILRNGASGTLQQTGVLTLSDAATIENNVGGAYALTYTAILSTGTGTSVVNGGSFVSNGTDVIAASVTNKSTGTISADYYTELTGGLDDSGSIDLVGGAYLDIEGGSSTLSGIVSGATFAALQIGAGQLTLTSGASLSMVGFQLYGGTTTIATDLTYGGAYYQDDGNLDIESGGALILTGATSTSEILGGTIAGSGLFFNQSSEDLEIDGPGVVLAGSVILRNGAGASVFQETDITLADTATVENHSGGVYQISDASVLATGGETSFVNGGSFIDHTDLILFGSHDVMEANFVNKSTGTISTNGSLYFEGGLADSGSIAIGDGRYVGLDNGTSTIAGVVSGDATFAITGGQTTFTSGASLTVADFDLEGAATIATDLTYAGFYYQYLGALDLASGAELILTGEVTNEIRGSSITGSGELLSQGQLALQDGLLISGSVTLLNDSLLDVDGVTNLTDSVVLDNSMSGTVSQSSTVVVGAMATLENQGSYGIDNASIAENGLGASFVNSGTLTASATAQDSITVTTLTNSGTLLAQSGDLTISTADFDNTGTLTAETGSIELGPLILTNTISNTGTFWADNGDLVVGGSLSGTGHDEISGVGILSFAGAVASGQAVLFAPSTTGTLRLGLAQGFQGTVAGLATTNQIDLANFAFSGTPTLSITGSRSTGGTYGHGSVDVTVTDGSLSATLDLLNQSANQYSTSPSGYKLVSDGAGSAGTLFELASHA